MNKTEFYKNFIDAQKKCGQGTSGLVALSDEIAIYIKEFIDEGLIVECDTGGTLGHRLSNIFYMPSKGYNVWLDDEGKNLSFVRFYLGVSEMDRVSSGDENKDRLSKFLNPTVFDFIRDTDVMKYYTTWLEKNQQELEIMLSLEDLYFEKEIKFSDDEIKYIKARDWYKSDKNIFEIITLSEEFINNATEIISARKELISLYKRINILDTDQLNDIKNNEDEIAIYESDIKFRMKFIKWLKSQDSNINIKELVNNYIKDT